MLHGIPGTAARKLTYATPPAVNRKITVTATSEPAIEAIQAVTPERSENSVANVTYTSGTMKKNSPSANPHAKPAHPARRSSRASCGIRSASTKSKVQQYESDGLHAVIGPALARVRRLGAQ